jgi:hypothetical protein
MSKLHDLIEHMICPNVFFGQLVVQWHQFKQLLIRVKLHHEMKNHAYPSMKRKCY